MVIEQITKLEKQKSDLEKCLELLEDYSYDFEEGIRIETTSHFTFTTAGQW